MLKLPFYQRVLGYFRVHTDERHATRFQNLIYKAHILAYPCGTAVFLVPRKEKERLAQAAKRERLPLSFGEILGLPRFFLAYRFRIGIPIGALLASLLLFWGTHTVWRVEVSGSETIPAEKIESELLDLGFGIGSRTAQKNYDALITAYRLEHPEVAWMGIYTEGTTAHVRIIENKAHTDTELPLPPSHLVAEADALIVRMDIEHGTAAVKRGEVVKKGDVLVLGYAKGAHEDSVFAAKGSVIGRVTEDISVEIPYKQTVKVEQNREKVQVYLNFFEKNINIFKKSNKNASDYVIIKRKERFSLPGGRSLPFGYTVAEALFFAQTEIELDKDEAIREGMDDLEARIRAAVGDGTLLARSIRIEEKDGSCVLHATVEYTKNIAKRLPFAVN